MALNQSNRLIRMTTGPLGPDEVVVTSSDRTRGDLASFQLRDRVHLDAGSISGPAT